jgi:ABC-2 type transport system permease protein
MNNYLSLTKVLLKNGSNSFSSDGKKNFKSIFLILLVIGAFIPMLSGISAFISETYNVLLKIKQEGVILGFGLSAVSLAIFFFGIFYIINVFYFSKDIENLLPLPFRPYEILLAKLTVTIIYEYLTEIIFLLPILITYGVKSSASFGYYIYCLLIFLILPIVPLIISSILDMIVLRFTNIAKNKDRLRIISGISSPTSISLYAGHLKLFMPAFFSSSNVSIIISSFL